MTPEQIRADRATGTPGPWRVGANNPSRVYDLASNEVYQRDPSFRDSERCEANARRIARLPELEDAYLALTDRVAQLKKALAAIELQGGLAETYDPVVSAICRTALTGETL